MRLGLQVVLHAHCMSAGGASRALHRSKVEMLDRISAFLYYVSTACSNTKASEFRAAVSTYLSGTFRMCQRTGFWHFSWVF